MMMSRRSIRRATVLPALLGLALTAACGSSQPSAAGSSVTGNSGATTTPSQSPITVGIADDITGPNAAELAASVNVAKAWVAWVNRTQDGIKGHPVKLVVVDTKGDPATSELAAQTLIDDHVAAEIGGQNLVTNTVWMKALTSAHIPVIGGITDDATIGPSSPYQFWLQVDTTQLINLVVKAAKTSGAKKFGAIACAEYTTCAQSQIYQTLSKKYGLSWAGLVQVRASDPSYAAPCLTLQQNGANAVFLAVVASVGIRVMNACSAENVKPGAYEVAEIGFDGNQLKLASLAGANITGVLEAFPWWINTPAVEQYRTVMQAYSPEKSVPQNPAQSGTWAAFELFRTAMDAAPESTTINAATVADAMWNVKNETLGGLLPQPVSFAKGKDSSYLDCAFVGELNGGQLEGGQPQCTG